MPKRLQIWWEFLHTSIWPIPVVMIVGALGLREVASLLDDAVPNETALQTWWLHSGSGDDARNLLSTLVSALITMASVMFSITMVVLSLAAAQFGSRLVRIYMSDIWTKLALGIFVMTIVYCVLVLRTVYMDMQPADVPHVSVTLGLFLALVCILTMLVFLHVLARSMVADDVIRRVARELEEAIDRLPPLEASPHASAPLDGARRERDGSTILTSRGEGYVQAIEYDALCKLACRHGLTVELHCKAGGFMCKDGWLASVSPGSSVTAEIDDAIQDQVRIGARRTPNQDLEFPIRHLVDVALRALSPGINDPNTAIVVVDHLRGALSRLMARRIPRAMRRDEVGIPRVIGIDTGYGDIFDEAFNQIRQAGAGQPSVIIHMLGAIERLAEHIQLPEQQSALLHHLTLIAAAGLGNTEAQRDRADIEDRKAAAERKLRQASSARLSPVPEKSPTEQGIAVLGPNSHRLGAGV